MYRLRFKDFRLGFHITCGMVWVSLLLVGCAGDGGGETAVLSPTPNAMTVPTETVFPEPVTPTVRSTPTATTSMAVTETPMPIAVIELLTTLPAPVEHVSPVTPSLAEDEPLAQVVLFARDDDLWRVDLLGEHMEQLTSGQALGWRMSEEDEEWRLNARMLSPQVSPNGRFITFMPALRASSAVGLSQLDNGFLLVDVTSENSKPLALGAPGGFHAAWSPDSRYFVYRAVDLVQSSAQFESVYLVNVEQQEHVELLRSPTTPNNFHLSGLVWSPDGRFLAFACCLTANEPYDGLFTGFIQQLELQTGTVEAVGEVDASIGGGVPTLCWTTAGEVVSLNEADSDAEAAVSCSFQANYSTSQPPSTKVDAFLQPISAEDTFWEEGSLLTVTAENSDYVLWQQAFDLPLRHVRWSPDRQFLLLDDVSLNSPIWRLAANGQDELQVVVEDGYLLDVIPQWQNLPLAAVDTMDVIPPAPQPGWTWHEDEAAPGVAFQLPEAWEKRSVRPARYQSSVSNSLIEIEAVELTDLGWRRWIQTRSQPGYSLAEEFVEPNGVLKDRPVFLMVEQSPGSYVAEFFINDGARVIRFLYQYAGGLPLLEETETIQTMFETLQFAAQNEGETSLPTAWLEGQTLTVFDPERLNFTSSPEMISGTVEAWEVDPTALPRGTVIDSNGTEYQIDLAARYRFQGAGLLSSRDGSLVELGQPVTITGYRQEELPNGLVRFYPIIVETTLTTGEELVVYQPFFDMNRFAPDLLAQYLTGAEILLNGRWAQLADYVQLPPDLEAVQFAPDDEIIAVGTIQSAAPPLLQATQLHRLDGSCKLYTTDREFCQFYIAADGTSPLPTPLAG